MKLQKIFFALCCTAALLFITSPARAQAEPEAVPPPELAHQDDRRANLPLPTGAWEAVFSTKLQGDSPGLLTFTSDGTVMADEPGGAFETTGHGNWKRLGLRTFAFTFIAYIGSANSQLTAKIKVSGVVVLSRDQRSFAGDFKVDVFDPKGSKIFADNGIVKGTRIKIEDID